MLFLWATVGLPTAMKEQIDLGRTKVVTDSFQDRSTVAILGWRSTRCFEWLGRRRKANLIRRVVILRKTDLSKITNKKIDLPLAVLGPERNLESVLSNDIFQSSPKNFLPSLYCCWTRVFIVVGLEYLLGHSFVLLSDTLLQLLMTIKLYIDYVSQPSRAVLTFCLINKLPFQVIKVNLFKLDVSHLPLSNTRRSL